VDDPRRNNDEDERARKRLRLKRLLEPFQAEILDYSLSELPSIKTIIATKYGEEQVIFEQESQVEIERNYKYHLTGTLLLQRTQPDKDPRRVKLIGVQ
jgi:hypothetical protein